MTAPNSNVFVLALQAGGGAGLGQMLVPMILVFGIFYLLIIRPQQKKQRQAQTEREQMLSSLKPGDKIVTNGGIYGTLIAVRDTTVQLRIAQSVSIEVLKSAIAGMQD
ncbi:MAG TPA: preprotein translocase subunit YajC, partial [Blastocatellia bacterium]|nr:preprotein translocase subunit YajC [Blastocatellia bacterium]